jgi:hypothetical protein
MIALLMLAIPHHLFKCPTNPALPSTLVNHCQKMGNQGTNKKQV